MIYSPVHQFHWTSLNKISSSNQHVNFNLSFRRQKTMCPFGLGWNSWNAHLRFSFFFLLFYFLYHAYQANFFLLFIHCCGYCSWIIAAKFDFFPPFQHKFHFSAIFSLKMGLTILFIHLKIILLQYFSVFNFQLYPNRPYIKRI